MRLERFISDLLFVHDCVIVPGFGGMVANYRAARLNRSTHIIQPPSKHVGFNRHLVQNDGLLVAYVSSVANITYHQAQQQVEQLVSEMKKELAERGRLAWEKIGVFFYDSSGLLHFIPEDQENFLPDAFGLSAVQLKPIASVEQEKEESSAEVIPLTPATSTVASTVWKIAAAIALPIALGVGLWFSTGQGNTKFNFASLNPFNNKEVVASYKMLTPNERSVSESPAVTGWQEALQSMPGASSITFDFVADRVADVGIDVIVSKPVAVADSTYTKYETPTVKPVSSGRFEVIGGAFGVEANAEKFLNELIAEGYEAHYAGKKGTLTLVSYGSSSSQAEASSLLSKVRSSGRNGWIKK